MPKHKIFLMAFAKVYPLYVQKAERKGRTKQEVDEIICWLTGYDGAGLQHQVEQNTTSRRSSLKHRRFIRIAPSSRASSAVCASKRSMIH